jgi:hypothetical protein
MPGGRPKAALDAPELGPFWCVAFACFNLTTVDVRQHVPKIAHVEPLPAPGAFHVMVGLSRGDTVRVDAGFR